MNGLKTKNIITNLIRLAKIESISKPDDAVYPFVQKCCNVLGEYSKTADEMGLRSRNFDYTCVRVGIGKTDTANTADTVGI